MIEKVLSEIGLTQSEVKVYNALLDLGEAKASQILDKANLNSGKIYEILTSLHKKGLISQIKKEGKLYFSCGDPRNIIEFLDKKENEIKKQKDDVSSILDEIQSKLNSNRPDTKIEVYMGLNGLKTAYEKEVKRYAKGKQVYVIGVSHSEDYDPAVFNYFKFHVYKHRKLSGMITKKIMHADASNKSSFREELADIKYLPLTSDVTTNVIDDLTIMTIFLKTGPICITIENEEFAQSNIENFKLLWGSAK